MALGIWREMLKFNVQQFNILHCQQQTYCHCMPVRAVNSEHLSLFVSLESVLVKKVSLFLFSCNGYDLKL